MTKMRLKYLRHGDYPNCRSFLANIFPMNDNRTAKLLKNKILIRLMENTAYIYIYIYIYDVSFDLCIYCSISMWAFLVI